MNSFILGIILIGFINPTPYINSPDTYVYIGEENTSAEIRQYWDCSISETAQTQIISYAYQKNLDPTYLLAIACMRSYLYEDYIGQPLTGYKLNAINYNGVKTGGYGFGLFCIDFNIVNAYIYTTYSHFGLKVYNGRTEQSYYSDAPAVIKEFEDMLKSGSNLVINNATRYFSVLIGLEYCDYFVSCMSSKEKAELNSVYTALKKLELWSDLNIKK